MTDILKVFGKYPIIFLDFSRIFLFMIYLATPTVASCVTAPNDKMINDLGEGIRGPVREWVPAFPCKGPSGTR